MQEQHEIQLSVVEFDYLKQIISHSASLARLLESRQVLHAHRPSIRLSRAEAEQLRDYLTVRLAEVGFGDDYSPNEQGQMLEQLIDTLYLR